MYAEKERLVPPDDGWRLASTYMANNRWVYSYEAPVDTPPSIPEHAAILLIPAQSLSAGFFWTKTLESGESGDSERILLSGDTNYQLLEKPFVLSVHWVGTPEMGYKPRPACVRLVGPTPPLPMGAGQKKAAERIALDLLPILQRVYDLLKKPIGLTVKAETRAGRGGWKRALRSYDFVFDGVLKTVSGKEVGK